MKPILFNTEMVRAILDGRKTVTRRVVKDPYHISGDGEVCRITGLAIHKGTNVTHGAPYPDSPYRPGDILWVRETWRPHAAWSGSCIGCEIEYKAGGENLIINDSIIAVPETVTPWRPSIHMPREAARIFLRVTDVRVERLQNIDADGIRSEGLASACVHAGDMEIATQEFALLWDSTIKPADREKYGWAANPWVWVIAFERCKKPKEAET